jgi:hypothetical protein
VVDANTLEKLFGDNFLKNCQRKAELESVDNNESTDRTSKQISDQDVQEALYGLPFADQRYEEEIREYLQDLLENITTGDEDHDYQQIEVYSGVIAQQ